MLREDLFWHMTHQISKHNHTVWSGDTHPMMMLNMENVWLKWLAWLKIRPYTQKASSGARLYVKGSTFYLHDIHCSTNTQDCQAWRGRLCSRPKDRPHHCLKEYYMAWIIKTGCCWWWWNVQSIVVNRVHYKKRLLLSYLYTVAQDCLSVCARSFYVCIWVFCQCNTTINTAL